MGEGRNSTTRSREATDNDQWDDSAGTTTTDTASIEEVAVQDNGSGSRPPTPRFIQDEGPWKRWKWVPYPVRRASVAAVRWARGPPAPRDHKIEPFLPMVQHAPLWLLDRFLPRCRHRVWLVAAYFAIWIVTFALVMRRGFLSPEIEGWGKPDDIGCGNTYWVPGNMCGLNGLDCRPFNNSGFAFKCPANCATYSVLNPRAVGDTEVIYQPLVIGGPTSSSSSAGSDDARGVYRGDSFICGAAIHAGVITNGEGGCGVIRLIGTQSDYAGSTRNGISSVGFDSYFPLSYTFDIGAECQSQDQRWALLAVSVVFTTFLSLFTTSPTLFFFGTFVGVFWNTGLASDPPSYISVPDLISNIVGKFLPATLIAWVIYDKMGVRRTLKGLTAQIEKTVLWVGGLWVGALTNYTFDFIPIQRLTPHDLQQQPGAGAALAIVIIVLVVVAISQIWFFQREGRLLRYLKLYILFGVGLAICAVLPDLSLRIHHYFLALLLLPGTSMQTRPSLLYQGLLVGLYINGVARWGFDPVLQTSADLQNDAQIGSPLPVIPAPAISLGDNASTITFDWSAPPSTLYDGLSVLVNDVERFRTFFYDDSDNAENFTWARNGDQAVREYFRFAYMQGSQSEDYTKAGIWDEKGEWEPMKSGPSRIKSRSLDGESRQSMSKK